MVCLKKDISKPPPSRHPPPPFLPKENKGPHKEKKGPPHGEKDPHNVKKNPLGKKFQKEANAYYSPPPERPCMTLLQYYTNAREISSSPPTPHPHNEIVIF